ncbi:hypothetical protein QR680_010717 [Steinernema hermaphroditum]|uniref:Uncharacterized protein n=1 Tax=Steinernema hermaphroditum TaxID=289476 RepID=A0AA39MBN6_9BILA|nr:hypothetical protein QR680_010717 [Steinernema hermaphroditum]
MDRVPYKFCEDVIGSAVSTIPLWRARHLSGLWRIAAEKYDENLCILEITVGRNIPERISRVAVWEELYLGFSFTDEPVFSISNKELVEKLIPFLNAQCLSYCSHYYTLYGSPEDRDEDLQVFQRYVSFDHMKIDYYNQHSEDYLVAQTKNNTRLRRLDLNFYDPDWPHSEKVDDLLIDLLRKPTKMSIGVCPSAESQMMTMRTVKDVFKRWCETGEASDISATSNVTEKELLSLTVPEGVTRYVERGNRECTTYVIVDWRTETESFLRCELNFNKKSRDVVLEISV